MVVVDLPGFGDTRLTQEQIITEISRCVALTTPSASSGEEESDGEMGGDVEGGAVAGRGHVLPLPPVGGGEARCPFLPACCGE